MTGKKRNYKEKPKNFGLKIIYNVQSKNSHDELWFSSEAVRDLQAEYIKNNYQDLAVIMKISRS
jgi:hypothetical protein